MEGDVSDNERDIVRDLEIVIEDALHEDLRLRPDDLRCPPVAAASGDTREMGIQGMILDAELAGRITVPQCRALIRMAYDKMNGLTMRAGKVNEDGSVTELIMEVTDGG
jgi:hypothetical protein